MILIRYDKRGPQEPENPDRAELCRQREYGYEKVDLDDGSVRVQFPNFGRGSERWPDFAVEVEWTDIRDCVAAFIEMEHPEALHLQRLIKLAEAIEGAGWSPDEPPEEEFSQILPQSD